MLIISFAAIIISSIIVSIFDIVYRKIPVLLLGINLFSIILYISLLFELPGVILGLLVTIVFIGTIIKDLNIDGTYLVLCIGVILLLRQYAMFIPYTAIPMIIIMCVLFNYKDRIPHVACLSIGITCLLLGGVI